MVLTFSIENLLKKPESDKGEDEKDNVEDLGGVPDELHRENGPRESSPDTSAENFDCSIEQGESHFQIFFFLFIAFFLYSIFLIFTTSAAFPRHHRKCEAELCKFIFESLKNAKALKYDQLVNRLFIINRTLRMLSLRNITVAIHDG